MVSFTPSTSCKSTTTQYINTYMQYTAIFMTEIPSAVTWLVAVMLRIQAEPRLTLQFSTFFVENVFLLKLIQEEQGVKSLKKEWAQNTGKLQLKGLPRNGVVQ